MLGNTVIIKEFDGHYPLQRDGQIPENGFSNLENVMVTSRGTLKVRPGVSTIGSQNFRAGEMVGFWTTSAGDRKIVVAHQNGGSLGTSVLDMDGDAMATASPAVSADLVLQWNDMLHMFTTVNDLRTWEGPGTAINTMIDINANVGLVHKSRMFVANNAAGDLTNTVIRYSEIFDLDAPNTVGGWPSLNTINISADDGDFITAMALLNDTLIVFKRFSTWAVHVEGLPPWTVRNLHPNIGCIGRDTAIVIGGLLYFRAATGVYRTDGTNFELLSGPIEELLDDDPGMVHNECNQRSAVWWGDYYLLNDYANGRAYTIYEVYNIENGAWSRFHFPDALTGVDQSLRALVDPESSPPKVLMLQYTASIDSGSLQEFVETNDHEDDGADIEVVVDSKMYDFDKPADWKLVREVDVGLSIISPFNSQSMAMTTRSESVAQSLQSKTLGAEQRSLFRFRGPMRCRAMGFSIEFAPAGDLEIDNLIFDVGVVGRVGNAH